MLIYSSKIGRLSYVYLKQYWNKSHQTKNTLLAKIPPITIRARQKKNNSNLQENYFLRFK